MKRFADFISKRNILILLIGLLLLIPSVYGYLRTPINYNVLVYLPEDIETVQGEKILTEKYGLGAFAFVVEETSNPRHILELEEEIKEIHGVKKVFSLNDIIGSTIPYEILPSQVEGAFYHDGKTILFVSFEGSTSDEVTAEAVEDLREVVKDANRVSSFSAMLLDMRDTLDHEISIYIVIAVILCLLILLFATDSYMMPLFLLGNIGIAILYNMGSNIFLGQISYITKAISAVLQLGVTADFSIFLYHKFAQARGEEKDTQHAMSRAIQETFQSVIGSSLTTFAGFLSLCMMNFKLGSDIGIVMAKGIFCGLFTVLTIFPALILTFDPLIQKTKHKHIFPKFKRIQSFSIRYHLPIFVLFVLLWIPATIGNENYNIYYKLDQSLPDYLPFKVANQTVSNDFHITSPEMILVDKDMKKVDVEKMMGEIEALDGIDFIISPGTLLSEGEMMLLPDEVSDMLQDDQYQILLLNSSYEVASKKLNHQVEEIDTIVKKYDSSAIVAGEGPLMKDLVTIADHDFKMVNYTSIAVIFVIMILVLQSFSLPLILTLTIEFAIFTNMAISYYIGDTLPFVASIVVGTIQLGATIDYAILMSTRYLEERRVYEKKKAIEEALKTTVPSIITSALCFFFATVGVALYTEIDMIGSICSLLARGSIISMFVVILTLPSLLMIFDSFILKFTKTKKGDISMKKNMKKVACFFLSILLLQPFSVFAMVKTETVYSTLKSSGSVEKTIVDSELKEIEKGDIYDYSYIESIQNMNGHEKFSRDSEKLTWKSTGKDIYYQGHYKNELPIEVSVQYFLNGKEYTTSELKGKSGDISIKIHFHNRDYIESENLYVPYLVNTTAILSNKNNSRIHISNGKSISTGANTVITAIAAPGLYESTKILEFQDLDQVEISYYTSQFEKMDIYFVLTPKLLEEIDLDRLNDIHSLTESLNLLQDGMNQVEGGSKQLADGNRLIAEKSILMRDGLEELSGGMNMLNDSIKQVTGVVKDVSETVMVINEAFKQVTYDSFTITEEQYNSLPESVRETLSQMIGIYEANQDMMISLQELDASLEATYRLYGLDQDEYTIRAELIAMNADENTIQLLLNTKKVFELRYQDNEELIERLNESIRELLVGENGILNMVSYYLNIINDSATQLANGSNAINDGLYQVYQGSIQLTDALNLVADSTETLSNGISKINTEGIHKITDLGNEVDYYSTLAKKLVELSKNYSGFACNNANQTIFIYKLKM